MDDIDRDIINAIQSDYPITPRPYLELGKRFEISESEVLERVKRLKESGIIRRIGANFNSKKLNFTSTLCAAKVPKEQLAGFVTKVNSHSGVTHNYMRDHEYNVWFTFIAPSMAAVEKALKEISETTGVPDVRNLPAVKTYKIKVDFEV